MWERVKTGTTITLTGNLGKKTSVDTGSKYGWNFKEIRKLLGGQPEGSLAKEQ